MRIGGKRIGAVAALALVGLLAVGTWQWWRHQPPAITSGACSGCNLLLITIDTLRADRVGAFGSARGLTPNLDRLANAGVRFTHAYASAPLTLPSHTSILTAVSPPVHGVRANGLSRLGTSLPTLATVLHDRSYRTGAFVGAFVLDARFGLNRGFDEYDDRYGEKHEGDQTEGAERRAEDVIRPAARWIVSRGRHDSSSGAPTSGVQAGAGGEKWFAWVHLYDPHEPYRAPEPYASLHEPYDAEVAYVDAMVGKLIEDLGAAGRLDRTLVIVAADHGESLGEHGERTHGVFVYDATMRVPWFIWTGQPASGRAFDGLARLIDLTPTALDLMGVPSPSGFEGQSLVPALNGRTPPPSTAYIEAMDAHLTRNWSPLSGMISGSFKLIDLPLAELYDLAADPAETINLFGREAARAGVISTLLSETLASFASRGAGAQKTTLNAEARMRLQALGYVGSSADQGQRVYSEKDDPKTLIGPSNELEASVKAFNAGSRTEAVKTVRAIIRDHPDFSTPYGQLASMQRASGDLSGAIATLDDIVRRGIADHRVIVVLAGYLMQSGDSSKAIGLLQAVIAAHPDDVEAHNSLGVARMRRGEVEAARAEFGKVLRLDPTSATAYANLGANDLAAKEVGAAIEHLKRAVELDPRQFDALYNLGLALWENGRRDEAQPYLEQFVRTAPPARYAADSEKMQTLLKR